MSKTRRSTIFIRILRSHFGLTGMFLLLLMVFAPAYGQTGMGQGHGHSGDHSAWPDSLEIVELSGTIIADSASVHPMLYLDVDGDGEADYRLMFGPYWYQPASGARRPGAGEQVTLTGSVEKDGIEAAVVVFTLNGQEWRQAIEVGEHGWNMMGFWADTLSTVEVSGTVLVDTTYFYPHYFLDTDGDSLPEYMLNFGPPWYQPASGMLRPGNGDQVTVSGGLHTGMFGTESLMVYQINGEIWRQDYGAPPWAGGWVHRDATDTTFVYCAIDSLSHMAFTPGAMMGGMMGQPSFPDSMFVQFEGVYPDYMPGAHDTTFLAGFFVNLYEPNGAQMMAGGGGMGMHHGSMRFNRSLRLQFHYDEEQVRRMGYDERNMGIMAWDEEMGIWRPFSSAQVDTANNRITVNSDEVYSYFAITSEPLTTGLHNAGGTPAPVLDSFSLKPHYPNPFRIGGKGTQATIRYEIPVKSDIVVSIFDLQGRLIWQQKMGAGSQGEHTVRWQGVDLNGQLVASGIYLISVRAGNLIRTAKITVIR